MVEKFEWDEAKSERNRAERGFDFDFAKHRFDGDVLERADTRRAYGEERIVAFGKIEDEATGPHCGGFILCGERTPGPVHGFIKKTRKTPKRDIDLALKRKKGERRDEEKPNQFI